MTKTMMSVREKIYWAIKPWHGKKYARIYDIVMLIAIAVGILPLMFRYHYEAFWYLNLFSGFCFVLDYILRWMTADFEMKKYRKWESFVWYPFTPMAIIDLLSILPVFNLLNPTFKVARLTRLLMTLRVFKAIRYFEPLEIVLSVIRSQRKILLTVLSLALFYIFITALIMFNAEEDINPETGKYLFETFFEAFYWAACTLTTVGYGDLYPISSIGRIISIISSMVGIAIIALPSGIITAGYMDEQRSRREKKEPHSES
jgi:voltage-gated potassium channel